MGKYKPSIYVRAMFPEPPKEWDIDQDIHTRHCCRSHGCKYGEDDECTVMITKHPGMTGKCQSCWEGTWM